MASCWAAPRGGCGEPSREHYLTAGLWSGDSVSVIGFSWCKDAPKDVGIGSLTAKVLCEPHNNDLSDVDTAAIDAFAAIRGAVELANKRAGKRARKWKLRRFEADGPRFERWFLKAAANLCAMAETTNTWDLSGGPLKTIPKPIVSAAFGDSSLPAPMGLYCATQVGEQVEHKLGVSFAPLMEGAGSVVGFVFTFLGMRFLLWTSNRALPEALVLPGAHEAAWRRSELLYHLAYARHSVGGHLSHYIHFRWPGHKAPAWVYA